MTGYECPKCGYESETPGYCPRCGTKLEAANVKILVPTEDEDVPLP